MKKGILPLIVLILVVLIDYISKYLFANSVLPEVDISIGTLLDIQIKNKNSINGSLDLIKYIFPFSVILLAIIFTFKSSRTNNLERVSIFGIIGGILGNLILDKNLFNIKLFVKLPFHNIADLSVLLFSILIILSILVTDRRQN